MRALTVTPRNGCRGLDGKWALITGGASGIGAATARLLAAHGTSVIIADQDRRRGEQIAHLIRQEGGNAIFIDADISVATDVALLFAEIAARSIPLLHILFNNAGIEMVGTITELDETEWDRAITVNLKSVFLVSRAAVPFIAASGGGTIINNASTLGLLGTHASAAYCASKGGVIALTKAMAIDCAPLHIRVNCICPGPVATPLFDRFTSEEERSAIVHAVPLQRVANPEEIARVVVFLASDDSSFMTGSVVVIDGGLTSE